MPRGGKRKGAGRKSTGRFRYVAWLLPEKVEKLKKLALSQNCSEGKILEDFLG